MYLKGIEINGFKSFSNKVNLEFTKGLTAIVGPNGSGKSNILDAILWVLGEQSYKSIRAKDGKDVIFSGGKNKKPRSTASVSLIIDNSDRYIDIDSDEVSITRNINRNGENTYILNERKIRLKDINNLLMDTGIGKRAYSVIGQGKVDRIISSSSKELRNILDEAAGVKKAKIEKEISLKKLADVETEVEKIEFVENDLYNSVIELEEQSKLARQYKEYTKKIDIAKYLVYDFYIKDYTEKIDEGNKKSVELEFKLANLENDINDKTLKIEKNNEEKSQIEKNLEELLNSNDENTIKLEELSNKQIEYISKKANFDTKVKSSEEEILILESKKEEISSIIIKKNKNVQELNNEILETKKEIEKIENIINERINKRKNLEEDIKKCDENYKKYEVYKLKLEMSNEDVQKRIQQAKIKLENINYEKVQALNKLGDSKSYETLSFDLSELKNKYDKINKEKTRLQLEYEKINTRCDALEVNIKSNEFMNNAIKFIQNNSKDDDKVYGPLVNMIDVEEKYHLAITTIAGYSLNDIVVEDNLIAKKYIKLLKEKKIGSASFLPIKNLSKKILNNGNFNYARNFVINKTKNEKINAVINHVFSNTIIVKDMEEGIELSKKVKDKIVTLEGDVISQTGRITGGYITKKVDVTLAKMSEFQNLKIKKLNIAEKLEKEINTLDDLKEKITSLDEKVLKIKNIEREIATYDYEIKENEEFVLLKEKQLLADRKEISKIDKNIVENESLKEALKIELENTKDSEEEKNRLSELKINLAVFNEKKSNLIINLNEIKENFNEINNKYIEIRDFLDNKEKNYNFIEEEIQNIKREISKIQSNDTKSKEKINELTKKSITLSNDYKNLVENKSLFEIEKSKLENIYSNLLDEIKRNTNDCEKYKISINELDKYDESEYSQKVDLTNVKMLERNISLNEKSRQNLGEVNLGAIKEYDEKKKKYEELKNEKFDLLKAKDSVINLISDIDQDIINNFSEALTKIQENFSYMCRELLNGAKGTFKVQDENDMIETGIELNVKYKNKPEQSISLLSGGEKSMLAVAFIISIFMYKPSPFTFFDEVEAALDEQNTIKLVSLLKKFTSSQFIMITHNKQTMKGADKLYGVTMNKEVGESLIVSVDI